MTGGGTAGHVIPALPVIDRLRSEGIDVTFIGSKSGLEEKLLEGHDVAFYGIRTGKLRRYLSRENLTDAFRVISGIWQAFKLLRRLKPSVVFSKGSYVAFPVVVAAWVNRIPVVVHESDLTPGLANRLSMPLAKSLCLTFAESRVKGKHVLVTGTAVRQALTDGDAMRGREWLGVPPEARVLVVVGGSLGAATINDAVRLAHPELIKQFCVVHVVGDGNVDSTLEGPNYQQFEFISDSWGDVLAAADLVISRAGANALYELLSLRKVNILIPLGLKSSRGDQIENAQMSERHGWSFVLPEETLTKQSLAEAVNFVQRDLDYWRNNLETFEVRDSVNLLYNELTRVEHGMRPQY